MATTTPRYTLRKPAGTDLINVTTDISDNMDKIDAIPPAGVINAYGGTAAPTGWLLCNGAAVSRTTYSGLFGVIGTRFGVGDGSTTFNLPDFRDRYPIGQNIPTDPPTPSTLGNHNHGGITSGAGGTSFVANIPTLPINFIIKT